MIEEVLKSRISREVATAVAELLASEDLREITDGRGIYIPFRGPLREALNGYFQEQDLPPSRRPRSRPLTL